MLSGLQPCTLHKLRYTMSLVHHSPLCLLSHSVCWFGIHSDLKFPSNFKFNLKRYRPMSPHRSLITPSSHKFHYCIHSLHTRDNLWKPTCMSLGCGRKLEHYRANLHCHGKHVQTPHRQRPRSGLNTGLWCCEAEALPAAPLGHKIFQIQ